MLYRLMVLMVLRVEHIVACKLGCKCKRKRGGKARETKRWRDRDRAKETWTPNTYALARTTLKITIGCLCQSSSACADGARSVSAATPRLRPFRSRPRLHSFAASADVTRLEHHDAAARASSWCCPATSLAASHAFRVFFGPPRATGAASERRSLGVTIGTVSPEQTWPDGHGNRTIDPVDRSTDALPLAELEGLLELHHVFSVNRIPVSGEIIHLDDSVSLRS